MDQLVVKKIKEELLKRRAQIEDDLSNFTKKDSHEKIDHKAQFPDFGDKSDENVQEIDEYTTNLATEKVLEQTLKDINKALTRIEKGDYGVCKYCGKEINEKRLLARPVSSACIECKNKLQKG